MSTQPPPAKHASGSGRSVAVAKNSGYALAEFAWPALLSVIVTPVLVRELGTAAFGVLSLIAVVAGFFGLLDFGIGGAATRAIAGHLARDERRAAAEVLATVLVVYLAIGIVGAIVLAAAAPFIVSTVFRIPAELEQSARFAFWISAAGFPLILLVGAMASSLKAAQRFDLATRASVALSTATQLSWLALVLLGYELPALLAASVAVNLVAIVVYVRTTRAALREPVPWSFDRSILAGFGGFAGWFLIASIGVVILYQLDKLLLGSLLSVAAVTYYVVPGNLAGRIQGVLGAATQVVFPVAATFIAAEDRESLTRLYRDGTRLTFCLAATIAVPMAIFADRFLLHWIGPDFSERSTAVLVLLVGTYTLLGLSGVVWGLVFGAGLAKINALFVLAMGVADIALFVVLVPPHGIVGAAAAFLAGAAAGVPMLIVFAERRVLRLSGRTFVSEYMRVVPAVIGQIFVGLLLRSITPNLLVTLAVMSVTALVLPILYLVSGLAPPTDRALFWRFVARRPVT